MAGMEGGIGGPQLGWGRFWLVMVTLALAGIVLICISVRSGRADPFYPACLKPDGDWLHGVTRKECVGKDLRGHWYTAKVLKKARKVM